MRDVVPGVRTLDEEDMKIYISADQEGVAGVFSRREKSLYATEYATMELVAICEALLAEGVDEILVNSVHVIEYHKLPKKMMILHGLPRRDLYTEGLDSSYDAVPNVGHHAMAGGREKGCWRHTVLPHPISRAYSAVEAVWLNNLLVGEIGLLAAFAGVHDVPLVFVSGDYWACVEAEELVHGIGSVAVKRGVSYYGAISMTPQAAAEVSAQGVVRALANVGGIKPMKALEPVTLKVRYLFPERATDAVGGVAGAERMDERTVAVTYPDLPTLRDHLGCIRAPELEAYARDMSMERTTGLFTRLGGEPHLREPTYPPPAR